MKITLPAPLVTLFQEVERLVSPVYLVGGSVRDTLLKTTPHDYDFTTPLSPEKIERAIRRAGKKPYLTGKRFGTIGVMVHGQLVEITTFRTEKYTPGSRKPQVVFIDDITHDLSRRDFTINAMALKPDGTLVDPFHGLADLKEKCLRTVNKPFDRYNEDPLRMLRAARFAAQLNFTVERETKVQARRKAVKLLEISKERWNQELDKLLTADHPGVGLDFLARTNLLRFMLPELALQVGYDQDSPYHELPLWEHTVKTVCLTEKDLTLRWAALLHDVGKPFVRQKNRRGYSNYADHELVGAELILKIGPYLHWSRERTAAVSTIIRDHLDLESPLHEADSAARFRT